MFGDVIQEYKKKIMLGLTLYNFHNKTLLKLCPVKEDVV